MPTVQKNERRYGHGEQADSRLERSVTVDRLQLLPHEEEATKETECHQRQRYVRPRERKVSEEVEWQHRFGGGTFADGKKGQ